LEPLGADNIHSQVLLLETPPAKAFKAKGAVPMSMKDMLRNWGKSYPNGIVVM
jgi:hypothetical protein